MLSPYGETTVTGSTPWHPEPQFRGTFSIVSSCLITTGLCVWTAVHLNIPQYGRPSRQVWRKLGWLVVGLFAPEFVAWTAFDQRRRARKALLCAQKALRQDAPPSKLKRFLRTLFRRPNPKEVPHPGIAELQGSDVECLVTAKEKLHPWSMVHGFYIIMGGIAADTNGTDENFLANDEGRMTLTEEGFELLCKLRPGFLPNLTAGEVRDKSKANGLTKTLICLQAAWFCIQSITRLGQGLSISLLELNTFAHALCTFLIYSLWWEKPLDIEEPTLIRGETTHPFIALASIWSGACSFISSTFSPPELGPSNYISIDRYRPRDTHRYHADAAIVHFTPIPPSQPEKFGSSDALKEQWQREAPLKPDYQRIYHNDQVHGFYIDNYIEYRNLFEEYRGTRTTIDPGYRQVFGGFVDLSPSQVRCLQMANKVYREGHRLPDPPQKYLVHRATNGFRVDWGDMLEHMRSIFEKKGMPAATWAFLFGTTFAGFAYGGLHATAWSAPFPTRTQAVIWRSSTIVLLSSGPFLASMTFIPALIRILEGWVHRWLGEYPIAKWSQWSSLPLLFVFALGYLAARVYLVVECFVALQYLPPSVFEVPTWSQYFPHIA
ncbi:hypothetical protein BDV96DRAFT_647318 [Lophiotrema nucula]|uniref:Uncharacterized protein n=1 Tax=Lophiotrema nucula TaxID=690887 RepID=A0A6A5Z5B4_9PLEO|nr:hypothetical protein BDV96DRAFT_647318 [Lophiotrema nucula]